MPHTWMADTSRRGSTCCCCCMSGACSRRRDEYMLCLALCQPWLACSLFSTCLDPSSNTCGPAQAHLRPMTARAGAQLLVDAIMLLLLLHCCRLWATWKLHLSKSRLGKTMQGTRQTGIVLHT